MMGNHKLREEIFVCKKQIGGRLADRTRDRNRRRKNMSGIPAWAIDGKWSESLDDNDTSAE